MPADSLLLFLGNIFTETSVFNYRWRHVTPPLPFEPIL